MRAGRQGAASLRRPGGPPPYVGGYMRLAFQAGCEISGLAFDPAQRSKTIPT